jgi:hypothetical protein
MARVWSILGLGSNYFRRFLQGYSKMVVPLTNLTRKDKRWEWTKKCQEAFEKVKHALTNASLSWLPQSLESPLKWFRMLVWCWVSGYSFTERAFCSFGK